GERGFLVQRCRRDHQLLEEVELLLAEVSTATTIGGVRLRGGSQGNPGNSAGVDREVSFIGRRLKGRYLLERELGRGGFGVVHLATDEQLLSKRVVVKIMLNAAPDAWERRKFRNEIEALAKLNHPNIVSVYDLG